MREYRVFLIGAAAVASLLIISIGVYPGIRDLVMEGDQGEPDGGSGRAPSATGNSSGAPQSGAPQSGSPQRGAAIGNWIDLLATIDPQTHAQTGEWRLGANGLSSDDSIAQLTLPFAPSGEYDFEVEFTRNTGAQSVVIHFVAGMGQASFEIDAWNEHWAGIQNINENDIRSHTSRTRIAALVNGDRHTALIRVRSGRVEAILDGTTLATYEGDGSNLNLNSHFWRTPSPSDIGVGSYQSETTFHRIRVRPLAP